jgi:hypothetical protein
MKSVNKLEILMRHKDRRKSDFPLKEDKSMDGMILHLTTQHTGNVQGKGIVTLTSKSTASGSVQDVADLTSVAFSLSKDEPGQSVCWDFREMRVRVTHYTMTAAYLKSWTIEGSSDGDQWTEIHRATENSDFKAGWRKASFAVSKPAEWRFIRLIQTAKNHQGRDSFSLNSVELFRTLSEWETTSTAQKSLKTIDIRKGDKSRDGVISYLTSTHGGNVQEKGIGKITSQSGQSGSLSTVADLGSDSFWTSNDAPGQWICWDFGSRRLSVTHYTIGAVS